MTEGKYVWRRNTKLSKASIMGYNKEFKDTVGLAFCSPHNAREFSGAANMVNGHKGWQLTPNEFRCAFHNGLQTIFIFVAGTAKPYRNIKVRMCSMRAR